MFAAPVSKGQVVDENGKPLAGATVVQGDYNADSTVTIKSTLQTDASGAFPLLSPVRKTPGTWLVAWSEGRALAGAFASDKAPVLKLRPLQRVRVRLVDGAGHPVSGALLSLTARQQTGKERDGNTWLPQTKTKWPFPFQTRSGADGWADVAFGAKDDLVTMKVERAGFQTIGLHQSVSQERDLTVRMVPEAHLRGRLLLGATGKALEGKTVELLGQSKSPAPSDARGRFELSGLDETSGYLRLDSNDLVLPLKNWRTRRGQTLDVGDLRATRGSLVSGQVLGKNNKPLAGDYVFVAVHSEGGGFSGRSFAGLFSDVAGRFSLRLPPGRFDLNVFDQKEGTSTRETIQTVEGRDVKVDLAFATRAETTRTVPRPGVVPQGVRREVERAEYLSGQVVDLRTGAPIAGATVQAYGNSQLVSSGLSNEKGSFALSTLLVTGGNLADSYVLIAQAPGLLGAPVRVAATSEAPVSLSLSQGKPLSLRLVSSEGKPVAGVGVEAFSFSGGNGGESRIAAKTLVPSGVQAQSDENGVVSFAAMPESGFVELRTSAHEGFATNILTVALPRTGTATFKLARETVIKGRVMLGDERPFSVPGLSVKMQGWQYPWSDSENWRRNTVAPDGSFEITNVPSLEALGEPTYGINLDMWGINYGQEKEFVPGVKLAYVNGWNMMVTLAKGQSGGTERWISYIEGQDRGLRYAEGEHLTHDMVLQPLALLRGQLPAELLKKGRRDISYQPPTSIYGPWRVSPDSEGRFEIPVPVGSVQVNFPDGARTFSDLKAHEVRVVDFAKMRPTASSSSSAREFVGQMRQLTIRVLGPDGATVPRPNVVWKNPNRSFSPFGSDLRSDMDGTLSLWATGETGALELSSPDLDKAVQLKPTAGQDFYTIRLDRVPKVIPPDLYAAKATSSRVVLPRNSSAPLPSPASVAVGQMAPELRLDTFLQGGPLSLAKLRGRVVVIMGEQGNDDISERFRGRPVTFVRLMRNSQLKAAPENVIVALDPPIEGDWRGFNAHQLGLSDWNGCVLIGPDGRIAASNVGGRFAQAKIEQLLESAGEK